MRSSSAVERVAVNHRRRRFESFLRSPATAQGAGRTRPPPVPIARTRRGPGSPYLDGPGYGHCVFRIGEGQVLGPHKTPAAHRRGSSPLAPTNTRGERGPPPTSGQAHGTSAHKAQAGRGGERSGPYTESASQPAAPAGPAGAGRGDGGDGPTDGVAQGQEGQTYGVGGACGTGVQAPVT
jgi:hypothetical protein